MKYPEYQSDLNKIHRSEVTSQVVFSLASKLSLSSEKKARWQTLARLEVQTRDRYLNYMNNLGISPRVPMSAKLTGVLLAILFAVLPWGVVMKLLRDGTPPLIVVFSRLARECDERDKAFFDYVLAHELAIEKFATLELAGDRENSIEPVLELLCQDLNIAGLDLAGQALPQTRRKAQFPPRKQ